MADIEQTVGDTGPSSSERRSDMLVPIENVHPIRTNRVGILMLMN